MRIQRETPEDGEEPDVSSAVKKLSMFDERSVFEERSMFDERLRCQRQAVKGGARDHMAGDGRG